MKVALQLTCGVRKFVQALSALVVSVAGAPVAALTTADVAEMQDVLTRAMGLSAAYGLPCAPCELGGAIGGVVRLVFHDASGGGGKNRIGGPNGCIDFAGTKASFGLQGDVALLAAARAPYASRISVADWWVLAGNTALKWATTPIAGLASPLPGLLTSLAPGVLKLPFRYGRKDEANCDNLVSCGERCTTMLRLCGKVCRLQQHAAAIMDACSVCTFAAMASCCNDIVPSPSTAVRTQDEQFLPPATLSWNETQTRFRRFGLSDTEIIAFFGAHAVGNADFNNSGLATGGWVVTQSSFAPTYLRAILRRTWTNMHAPYTNVSAASLVWTNADADPTHVRCPHTLRFYMTCMQLRLSSLHDVYSSPAPISFTTTVTGKRDIDHAEE